MYAMLVQQREADIGAAPSRFRRRSTLSSLPVDRLQARLRFTTKRFNGSSPYWCFVVMTRQMALWLATVIPQPAQLANGCKLGGASSVGGSNGTNGTNPFAAAASLSPLPPLTNLSNATQQGTLVSCAAVVEVSGVSYDLNDVLFSATAALFIIAASWLAHQRQRPYVYPFQNCVCAGIPTSRLSCSSLS